MAPATFGTLPLELKAKIVEMASDQEDAWRRRVKDAERRAGHINCLSSLALINKELRALAAKQQFKVLRPGRDALPVCRFTILPFYGHHFTEVVFTDNEITDLDSTFAILPHLPSLRSLTFGRGAAIKLFGPDVTLSPAQSEESDARAFRATMLNLIAPKITQLILSDFKPPETVALIRGCPNLQTLLLLNLETPSHEEEVKGIMESLATLRRLAHLSIDLPTRSPACWTPNALEPLEHAPPPLKTLQLFYFPLRDQILDFISLFANTLETLSVDFSPPASEPGLSSRDPLPLSHLTHLNLSIHQPFIKDVLRLLTPCPTLSHLSFTCDHLGTTDPTDPTLTSFLAFQPNLRHVQLGEIETEVPFPSQSAEILSASSLAAYAELVRTRGLDPSVLERRHHSPFHPSADLNYTENNIAHHAEVLGRTLDFGKNELQRMLAEGNVARAVGWVEKLKPLEEERLAWKD